MEEFYACCLTVTHAANTKVAIRKSKSTNYYKNKSTT